MDFILLISEKNYVCACVCVCADKFLKSKRFVMIVVT